MTGNASKLMALTQRLSNQWLQTKDYWRDARSQEFERHYVEELLTSVDRAVPVIEELEKLVKKIRSDCE